MRSITWLSTVLLLVSVCGLASAQAGGPAYGSQPAYPAAQPTYQPQPGYPPNGAAPAGTSGVQVVDQTGGQESASTKEGRGVQVGGDLLLPIFLGKVGFKDGNFDLGKVPMNVGFGLQGRLGWEFDNGLSLHGRLGVMGNSFDYGLDNFVLLNIWLGGSARYSFMNPSAFVPFVQGGVDVNFWAISLSNSNESVSATPTLGLNAAVGAAYETSKYFAIEFGLQLNYSLPGKFFQSGLAWIYPFVGGTVYF